MTDPHREQHMEILLVEDNPGDERLTREALREKNIDHRLSVVKDGVDALAFLRRQGTHRDAPRPDLILLDLNLPKKSGQEVLAEIGADPDLRDIPVVVLTLSRMDADIMDTLDLRAKSYIIKPVDVAQLAGVIAMVRARRDGASAQADA